MAASKGSNSTRRKRHPRFNRASRAQRIRRLKEKEVKLKLHYEQQVTKESIQNYPEDIHNINVLPVIKIESCEPSKESSKLPINTLCTTVVNSVPVISAVISYPAEKDLKKLFIQNVGRNKSSGIANRCRPKTSATRSAKAQRLRRAKEKEALMKLYSEQTDESFQEFFQKVRSTNSVATRSRDPSEENEKISDFPQNVTIIDPVSVIKTEILDPPENTHRSFFQDYPHDKTIVDPLSVVKTEILDSSRTSQKLLLPNTNVEQT